MLIFLQQEMLVSWKRQFQALTCFLLFAKSFTGQAGFVFRGSQTEQLQKQLLGVLQSAIRSIKFF
jgi:hypothetical protein